MYQASIFGSLRFSSFVDDELDAELKMNPAEKAALDAKRAADEKQRQDQLAVIKAAAEAEKTRQRLRDYANGGISKTKGARRCKGECYDGGCDVRKMHANACSFIHADELEPYTAIFAKYGIKMVDDSEFLELVKACDKITCPMARDSKKREIKALDEELKYQMKGRWLWVTGMDENGDLKFSRTNPELQQQRPPFHQRNTQTPQRGLLPLPQISRQRAF